MPTPITHAAVGVAFAAWTQPPPLARRVWIVAAACAALPDIDVLLSPWGVSHRAITHSLLFALTAALLATILLFPRGGAPGRREVAATLGLALLSHASLDALSTYSLGIEFFAPFSTQRFRFPWTPLGNPAGDLAGQLVQEALVVLLPALILAWLGLARRRA